MLRVMVNPSEEKTILGFPSIRLLLLMYVLPVTSSIAIYHYLIPDIPIWIPIFASLIYGFLMSLMVTAMQGVTGFTLPLPPYLWQALVYLSPYKGYAGFVFSPIIPGLGVGASPWVFAQRTKVALMTRTKPIDLVKLAIIAPLLAWILNFFSLNIFWSIAPMPSSVYPYTVYFMPQRAQMETFFVTRQLDVRASYIIFATVITFIIALLGDLLNKIGIPFSALGFFLGLYTLPTTAIPRFIGSLLSNVIMPRIYGRSTWRKIRGIAVAGEMVGEGTVITFLLSLTLLFRATWVWPW